MSLLLLTILGSLLWGFLFFLFPGLPNTSRECGGGGRADREKEAKRQEDVARQREQFQNESNQLLSQLIPGSQEFQELQELARLGVGDSTQRDAFFARAPQLVQQQQARIAAGGPATALEARTNLSVEGLRRTAAFTPEEQDILRIQRGESPTTAIGQGFQERIFGGDGADLIAELTRALSGQPTTTPLGAQAGRMVSIAGQPPDTAFEQELSLLQDRINREANSRGLASSGIPIEQLGRAGVELAVRKAMERENIRRTREADVLDLLSRAQQGDQTALGNLSALFTTGQQLRGREIGVEEAVTNLQAGRESKLTDLLQSQTGTATEHLLELLSTQTGRAEGLRDLASALRETERQRTEELIGTAAFGQSFQTAQQGSFGNVSPTPSSTRGRPAGTDVASLVAAQQTPTTGTTQPLGSSLSRRRLPSQEEEFAQLLAFVSQGMGGG